MHGVSNTYLNICAKSRKIVQVEKEINFSPLPRFSWYFCALKQKELLLQFQALNHILYHFGPRSKKKLARETIIFQAHNLFQLVKMLFGL